MNPFKSTWQKLDPFQKEGFVAIGLLSAAIFIYEVIQYFLTGNL